MIKESFKGLSGRGVSPVIAIVLLLMMTVAAAGAAYFWLTQMQSGIQEQSTESIENIMQSAGRRLVAQAAICEPRYHEGLVGWWRMDEGSGSYANDSSGNGNDGTIHGANWVDGKVGQALDFKGSDARDRVVVPHSSVFEMSNNFTISVWFNRQEEQSSAWGTLLSGVTGDDYCPWLHIDDTGGAAGFRYRHNGNKKDLRGTVGTIGYNEWHQLTVVKSTEGTFIYFDGSQALSDDSLTGAVDTGLADMYLGWWQGIGYWYNGTIDEVHIYDRALSAGEIKAASQKNGTYMRVKVTVRNVGTEEIPEAEFVANLKKDGTTVDSDTYTTTSSIDTDELKTLTFYFNEMRPGGEKYMISIPGIDVSQTVNCQSLE